MTRKIKIICMKKILIISLILTTSLFAYDKEIVIKAYKQLSQTFSYTDENGNKVSVRDLKYSCRGKDCKLLANGKAINPELVLGQVEVEETNPTPVPVSPSPSVGNESGIMKGMAEAHNVYRRSLNLPDLVWDSKLETYAQEWANHLQSKGCKMMHRSTHKYGENIAWAAGMQMSPQDVVKMWYDEVNDYNYANNSCRAVCGHYTQVVWKKSIRLGCGMAKCGDQEIWVCNYDPPGNYVGEKPY